MPITQKQRIRNSRTVARDTKLLDFDWILNPSKEVFDWRNINPLKQDRRDYM